MYVNLEIVIIGGVFFGAEFELDHVEPYLKTEARAYLVNSTPNGRSY
jgi:hypothetical protein